MLVVHPQDRTTDVLQLLYEGLEAKVITKECSNRMMGQFLHYTSIRDRIMLLGHGSERGLYYRMNDEEEGFDGIIVGHPQAYKLRRHGSNMIDWYLVSCSRVCQGRRSAWTILWNDYL